MTKSLKVNIDKNVKGLVRQKCPFCKCRIFELFKATDSEGGAIRCNKCKGVVLTLKDLDEPVMFTCPDCKKEYDKSLKHCPFCMMGNPTKSKFLAEE